MSDKAFLSSIDNKQHYRKKVYKEIASVGPVAQRAKATKNDQARKKNTWRTFIKGERECPP